MGGSSRTSLFLEPERLSARLQEIPAEPGVYFFRDYQDQILYIGKSKLLRSRVRSYFRDLASHSPRITLMVRQVVDIEFIVTDNEAEALALEANLIKQHQPHFNVLLKDDKKYPYVCITWSEVYPRIFITRKRRLGNPQDRYYGPYVDTGLLRSTLHLVYRTFPLRQRPRPLFKDRPCLNYSIGRCPGVCQALISPADYRHTVEKVAMIFQGRTADLVERLTEQMHQAAASLNFEQAAQLRNQIQGLEALGAQQKVALPDDRVSRDAIALASGGAYCSVQLFQIRAGHLVGRLGFLADPKAASPGEILQRVLEAHYTQVDPVEVPAEILVQHPLPEPELLAAALGERRGRRVEVKVPQRAAKAELLALVERNATYELVRLQRGEDRTTKALEDLARLLNLPAPPGRLEGYDISHIQGSDPVASRAVFLNGLPAPQDYRHYKITTPQVRSGHSDDYASLAEVIQRRFRNPDPKSWPDVVLIDGGKGQLSAVVKALANISLPAQFCLLSLAKQREEIFTPGARIPLATDPDQPGVQLLRRLRDEAHRFAVSFHRQQRRQRQQRSRLDEIPGLGHQRQKQLLASFRSLDYVRQATQAQLEEVPGIGPHLAAQIYRYFHPADT